MARRLRIGIEHPFPVFPNAGIYARNLNEKDAEKIAKLIPQFFEIMRLVAAVVPGLEIHEAAGYVAFRTFKFRFTLT